MLRILAAWPRPPMPDSTQLIWNEHLDAMDGDRAMKAVLVLETESKHRPSLSEFHEAYKTIPGAGPRSIEPPACGVCDNGFVEVGANTVTRCPNGCKPMTADERQMKEAREQREWEQHRRKVGAMTGTRPIDFTEPGSRHDPDEPF